MRGIPLDQVRPFYQVVVFRWEKGTEPPHLGREVVAVGRGSRRSRDSEFTVLRHDTDRALQYAHVEHTFVPSWCRGGGTFRNTEHDEALLYHTASHLFVHSNCDALLEALTTRVAKQFSRVRAGDIEKLVALRRVELRCLGMQNLFGPGQGAPESKTHFARNATYTLSPVSDTNFGFKYGFAVERSSGSQSKPFGCSTNRRKVWGTWVEDVKTFAAECDRLSTDLDRAASGPGWVLAARIGDIPRSVEPIAFYADYNVHRKGVVWLESDGHWSAEWRSYLTSSARATFEVTATDGAVHAFDIEVRRTDGGVELAYLAGDSPRRVKIADLGGELEHRRPRDLVAFLNEEQAFTVVLEKGLSYRDGQFWKNRALDTVFASATADIGWRAIDISKESRVPGKRNTIGDAIVRYLKKQAWPTMVVCDDGANEVADYIVMGADRVVLIHAKFSSEGRPGLRAKDLQEVLAQCLKNLQYFYWPALESHAARLEKRALPGFTKTRAVAKTLRSLLENQRTRRECWIVQPGVSVGKLQRSPKHKLHSLLNHAASACLPSNVEFRVFGSP